MSNTKNESSDSVLCNIIATKPLGVVAVCQKCKSKDLYESWLTDLTHCNKCHHYWQTER